MSVTPARCWYCFKLLTTRRQRLRCWMHDKHGLYLLLVWLIGLGLFFTIAAMGWPLSCLFYGLVGWMVVALAGAWYLDILI